MSNQRTLPTTTKTYSYARLLSYVGISILTGIIVAGMGVLTKNGQTANVGVGICVGAGLVLLILATVDSLEEPEVLDTLKTEN